VPDYNSFFHEALSQSPYPYQHKLASNPWPDILRIPTGMGKTASIILAWLFKRTNGDSETPARLVYCLPMRVLVEQTARATERWINTLAEKRLLNSKPVVHVLMGGEGSTDWDLHPHKDTILVGTQDQLLSRALNRGYSMSRFRWPVHFGLLNNGCLWVMDEVQLMGAGLETTAQLQAFRERLGTVTPTKSIWCSATLCREWLATVDFSSRSASLISLELDDSDLNDARVVKRRSAKKTLCRAPVGTTDYKALAKFVLESHQEGTRTLVILNTVSRAQQLFNSLKSISKSSRPVLLHSRYRPHDRKNNLDKLLSTPTAPGIICIATQVVEAGVDVTSTTLITELAPWPSLVQRFGRLNRDGAESAARVFWLDLDLARKGQANPYDPLELEEARRLLLNLEDAGPASLPEVTQQMPVRQVLRSVDLQDLFDTTNDIAGADVDISRFIRDSTDTDIQVFWRSFPEDEPDPQTASPNREELCSVPIGDLHGWLKTKQAWTWSHLDRIWRKVDRVSPGMVVLLRRRDGGYDSEAGWTGNSKDIPPELSSGIEKPEGYDDDLTVIRSWQSLAEHTDLVASSLEKIMVHFDQSLLPWRDDLITAARWHDAGKAHPVFQNALPDLRDMDRVWAKAPESGSRYTRPGFRHELASAILMLTSGQSDLSAFLAAAHHGKVRLSIRSLPGESVPKDSTMRFARGIWEGDIIPEVELGDGTRVPQTEMDLSLMELGEGSNGPSWTSRMLALRDDPSLGPFRLSFLEALLRIADWTASKEAQNA